MLLPDPGLMAAVGRDLSARLSVALTHIAGDVLDLDRRPVWPNDPCAFALQDLLRQAAEQNDLDGLRGTFLRFRDVLDSPPAPEPLQVLVWGSAALSGLQSALLQTAFQDDIGLTAHLLPPDPVAAARLQIAIPALLDRLDAICPLWAQEFRAMVRWVVLAGTSEGGFGGASAFAAWGAVLVNPAAQPDEAALLMTLIHESAHLKLFSAYLTDEIVLNPPDAAYSSPLRQEPRPMNGLYHAAYVLARMACFAEELERSGQAAAVLGASAARLPQLRAQAAAQFEAALDTISRHGRLTARGHAIMAEAEAAVRAIGT